MRRRPTRKLGAGEQIAHQLEVPLALSSGSGRHSTLLERTISETTGQLRVRRMPCISKRTRATKRVRGQEFATWTAECRMIISVGAAVRISDCVAKKSMKGVKKFRYATQQAEDNSRGNVTLLPSRSTPKTANLKPVFSM